MHFDEHGQVVTRMYEAPDGFRGTFKEVAEHEARLSQEGGLEKFVGNASSTTDEVLYELYESDDGKFRGSLDDVTAYEEATAKKSGSAAPVLFRIYESDDGKFHGTYDEVDAYEKNGGSGGEIFEANDGFRGTREEVLAHVHGEFGGGEVLFKVYESDDGKFRGSLDECEAYEKSVGHATGNEHALGAAAASHHDRVLFRVYESEDGQFRGTYDEVLAHEKKVAAGPNMFQSEDGFTGTYEQVFTRGQS